VNQPEKDAVDLDVVEDPTASARDRADDASLAVLVRARLQALELPPSRVDVAAATRRGADLGARARRRTAWATAGALVASAAVVAVVLVHGPTGPAERRSAVAVGTDGAPDDGGTTAVQLRAGVPELPKDEVARLEALQDSMPLSPPTYFAEPFSAWTTPVDCPAREPVVPETPAPAVLDGLDTNGLRQQCATADPTRGGGLYRFYLPDGVELDDVGLAGATDRGVSWTVVDVDEPVEAVQPGDWPSDPGGGVTTVRWQDAYSSVHRWWPGKTDLTWVEPHGWSDGDAIHPVTVRAVVATDPVLAVRAAAGFVNQGGTRVDLGDDGTLLLVPADDPMGEMQALTGGVLTRTREGCLLLDNGSYGFQLVLWPFGTTWDAASQVLTVPAGQDGSTDYRLGDEVSLGGGESDGRYAKDLVPAGCASEKVWIGGSAVVLPQGWADPAPTVVGP